MVSLRVLLDRHRKTGIQKAATHTRVEHTKKPLGKEFPKLAWIWGLNLRWRVFGLDFGDTEKGAEKIRAKSAPVSAIRAVFRENPCPNPCHKLKNPRRAVHLG